MPCGSWRSLFGFLLRDFSFLAVHGFFTFIFPLLVEWIGQVQSVDNQPRISNLAGLTASLCLYSSYICSILFVLSAATYDLPRGVLTPSHTQPDPGTVGGDLRATQTPLKDCFR